MCAGIAEDFIQWSHSLQTIFKGKSCDSAASKFEIVSLLLYGDLRNTEEDIITEHTNNAVRRTVRNREGIAEKKEMTRGYIKAGIPTCVKTLA